MWGLLRALDRVGLYDRMLSSRVGYLALGRVLPCSIFALILSAKATTLSAWFSLRTDRDSIAFLSLFAYQILVLAFLFIVCLLFIFRHPARPGAARLSAILLALAGTFITTPLSFASVTIDDSSLILLGVALMLAGISLSLLALVHLGRCFGISPQARGLVMAGPYRWIRHPLYVGEEISALGLLLPVISPFACTLFLLHCFIQYARARSEEQLLAAEFPEYAAYAQRSDRFIPHLY